MTDRERVRDILHYKSVDRIPVVHFGFLRETLDKWAEEGHISRDLAENQGDGNEADCEIGRKLGFDFNWQTMFVPFPGLKPPFECKVIERTPDGFEKVLNGDGVIEMHRPGAGSIPADIDHLLKDRASWEEHFLPRLRHEPSGIDDVWVPTPDGPKRFGDGGREWLDDPTRNNPIGFHLGSLYGRIRGWLTMEGSCYLQADDEDLFTEIIDTTADIQFRYAEAALSEYDAFDFAHFWEDICFKNGPIINPSVFREKVGPHYRRMTELVRSHGIDIVSLDCDGWIDALLPIWLENGVNTMFPIEVGTWEASMGPWRKKYGKQVLGVGGTNKRVLSYDRAAVDGEIERLRPLVEQGGYIPCPDHRLQGDVEWDLVVYYCERMRSVFG